MHMNIKVFAITQLIFELIRNSQRELCQEPQRKCQFSTQTPLVLGLDQGLGLDLASGLAISCVDLSRGPV